MTIQAEFIRAQNEFMKAQAGMWPTILDRLTTGGCDVKCAEALRAEIVRVHADHLRVTEKLQEGLESLREDFAAFLASEGNAVHVARTTSTEKDVRRMEDDIRRLWEEIRETRDLIPDWTNEKKGAVP